MRSVRNTLVFSTALILLALTFVSAYGQHDHDHATPTKNQLSEQQREELGRIIVQDFQGRMKPLDTLSREMVVKLTKRRHFEEWEPLDLYLSWLAFPEFWFEYPLLAVRFPDLKKLLGVDPATTHVSGRSLVNDQGQYSLSDEVEAALRTPDKSRSKLQRKVLSFDERFNLLFMSLQGRTLRIYPVPGDEKNTWVDIRTVQERVAPEEAERYQQSFVGILEGYKLNHIPRLLEGVSSVLAIQSQYGSAVLPSKTALNAEMLLNRIDPFTRVLWPYTLAFIILMVAFAWSLARRGGAPYTLRHPLYGVGIIMFWGALLLHLFGFILRWVASGRAPLSNGYESLIYVALMVAVAGFIFESKVRCGWIASLSALLATEVLGVSMMSAFNPAIGPLVPVLDSYWLNIHVTIITASYSVLGLGALSGALVLILYLFKGPGRTSIRNAIARIDKVLLWILITGLGMLTVGTLLGGVWANESWGRYWGWDPKETWALITILVYGVVLHFRWIPALNRPWIMASGNFLAISSVVMTYFGVNYLLSGLHSYAQGSAARVPDWVFIGSAMMVGLVLLSGWFDKHRSWGEDEDDKMPPQLGDHPKRVTV